MSMISSLTMNIRPGRRKRSNFPKKDNVSGEDKPIKSVTMALIHIILSLPPGEDKP
ncbi:hypothetical protein JMX37_00890 (plasmid) [Klebsiella pneumoniae]|jgi:hypothetical protein|nr:hypothetical protein JMX37_00890 [Klebsiella pneumoniae]